jgi:hypothetical protein
MDIDKAIFFVQISTDKRLLSEYNHAAPAKSWYFYGSNLVQKPEP